MDSTLKNSSSDGEWIGIASSKARGDSKPGNSLQEEQRWIPKDLEFDPERQTRLLEKMESCIQKIRRSNFYTTFFDQLKSPEVSEQFRLLLGSETQLQMVIYGIGRIEKSQGSRVQLSLALSMKKEVDWMGEIQVFDPVLSAAECSVIETLGCTILNVNENACREALKSTLFFMPRCCNYLYDNLIQANWSNGGLSKIALLGNSFEDWHGQQYSSRITRKFAIENATGDDFGSFDGISWHFFSPGVALNM